jgi:SAM-dependent methyltransferase
MSRLVLFALFSISSSRAFSLPLARQNARIMSLSSTIPAVDLFNTWAFEGKDEKMAAGHEQAVYEICSKAQSFIEQEKFSFIDIGCGNGWVCEAQSTNNRVRQAIGVDGAKNMIVKAKKTALNKKREESLSMEVKPPGLCTPTYIHSDINTYTPPNKFDFVFSMEVLYYLSEIQIPFVLKSIKEDYLTKNGLLVMGIDHYEVCLYFYTYGCF